MISTRAARKKACSLLIYFYYLFMSFSTLLRISRPRFRHYVLWPVLILLASMNFFHLDSIAYSWGLQLFIINGVLLFIILGYFTFPANLWIYGRNDLADEDTDAINKKKWTYEDKTIYSSHTRKNLIWHIFFRNIVYIIVSVTIPVLYIYYTEPNEYNTIMLFQTAWDIFFIILAILAPFFISSYLYSCPPLRAKARPFIDGLMNILYIITPLIIGALVSRESRNAIVHSAPDRVFRWDYIITVAFPALCRCMAMHCYSAIPDIDADHQAGLTTTAVYLGKQKSLIYCGILYLLSALFSFLTLWWMSIVGGIVYLTMIAISYRYDDIFRLYKKFPLINLIIGFCLFRYILLFV